MVGGELVEERGEILRCKKIIQMCKIFILCLFIKLNCGVSGLL